MATGSIRLLIITDLPEVARHLRELAGAQRDLELVGIVPDGPSAVARLDAVLPDVVAVDALVRGTLPLAELRDRGIPVVVMTVPGAKVEVDPARGIGAVVPLPRSGYELSAAVAKVLAPDAVATQARGRIIVVAGAKGGVGRTRLAVELAAASVALGQPAALLDASLPYGDVRPVMRIPDDALSIVDLPTDRIDAEDLERALFGHRSGVEVLAAPQHLEQAETVTPRDLEKVVAGLAEAFSAVVVDLPVVLDERTLALLDVADRVLVATTDDPVAAGNTARLLDTLGRLDYPAGKVHLARLRAVAGTPLPEALVAVAPGESAVHPVPDAGPTLERSLATGEPIGRLEPDGAYARAVGSLARTLVGVARPAAGIA